MKVMIFHSVVGILAYHLVAFIIIGQRQHSFNCAGSVVQTTKKMTHLKKAEDPHYQTLLEQTNTTVYLRTFSHSWITYSCPPPPTGHPSQPSTFVSTSIFWKQFHGILCECPFYNQTIRIIKVFSSVKIKNSETACLIPPSITAKSQINTHTCDVAGKAGDGILNNRQQ